MFEGSGVCCIEGQWKGKEEQKRDQGVCDLFQDIAQNDTGFLFVSDLCPMLFFRVGHHLIERSTALIFFLSVIFQLYLYTVLFIIFSYIF